ncbi:MAG UNVERIFIED_CONTAM: hypothetical protein LVT10_02610 [Anaerolineae bacterium]
MQSRKWLFIILVVGMSLRSGYALTRPHASRHGRLHPLQRRRTPHRPRARPLQQFILGASPLFPLWIALLGNHTPTVLIANALVGTLLIPSCLCHSASVGVG